MARQEFDRKTRAAIILRSRNASGEICCEACRLVLAGKPFRVDHILPEGLRAVEKKLTAADGQLLGQACCDAIKTPKDQAQIAKMKRQRDRASGAIVAKQKIHSAGFRKRPPRAAKPSLPVRNIYARPFITLGAVWDRPSVNGETDE